MVCQGVGNNFFDKFFRILLVVVIIYFTCYSFHSCSMMVEGSKLKDEDSIVYDMLIFGRKVDGKFEKIQS